MTHTVLPYLLFLTISPIAVTSSADVLFFSRESDLQRQSNDIPTPPYIQPELIMPKAPSETPNENRYIYNCINCPHLFKKWIHDEKELHEAAWFCGFDYLSVRFVQSFTVDSIQSTLIVHAHSCPDYSLQVDSVTTSFNTPRSTEETTAKIIRQSPVHPHLPLPFVYSPLPDISTHLTTVLQGTSRFRSRCTIDTDGMPVWSFTLQQKGYTVRNGEIISSTSDVPFSPGCGTAAKAYRLETWGTTTYTPSPHHREHASPPVLTITSVNDSQSIARAGIIAESEYGLSSCILSSGSINDTLRFSGVKRWHNSITVNALPQDTLLTVTVSDIHGNRTRRSSPLFLRQHARQRAKKEKREMELYTREIARNNPLLYGSWLLAHFSGNPISYIAKKALDYHADRKHSAMGDFTLTLPSDTLTFPLQGNVHTSRMERSFGRCTIPLYADSISFNGTQIARLVNPHPFSSSKKGRFVAITLQAPFSEGRHPLQWEIDSLTPIAISDTSATSLLLCSSVACKQKNLTLLNIPHILDRLSNTATFTLCHLPYPHQADTLTITYRIRYTDCSTILLYEQYRVREPDICISLGHQPSELHTIPSVHSGQSGQTEVLLKVTVYGAKDIFRIDAFVHSQRRNCITGWGVASLPG